MEELDKKDKILLENLYINSRMSHTQLAKKVGVSKDTIRNKINSFRQKEIISNFTCEVSLGKLGFDTFTVFFKFNEDISKHTDILDHFKEHPFCMWAVIVSGEYDILAEFISEDSFHIQKTISGIREHFGDRLNFYELDIFAKMLRINHLIKDFGKVNEKSTITKNDLKNKELDSLDKKILFEISKDSTLSLIEIADNVESSWDVVRYRIKQLESNKIIGNYHPMLNYKKLGYMPFIGKITLQNISQRSFEELELLINQDENITYAFTSLNSFSIIFNCVYKSIDDLDSFLRKVQEKFKGKIKSMSYYIQREQIKYTPFPKGLLE